MSRRANKPIPHDIYRYKLTDDDRKAIDNMLSWSEVYLLDNYDYLLINPADIRRELNKCACLYILERRYFEKTLGGIPERERNQALQGYMNELATKCSELCDALLTLDQNAINAMIRLGRNPYHPGMAINKCLESLNELRFNLAGAIEDIPNLPNKPKKDYQNEFIFCLLELIRNSSCTHNAIHDTYSGYGFDFVFGCFHSLTVNISPNVIANTIQKYRKNPS